MTKLPQRILSLLLILLPVAAYFLFRYLYPGLMEFDNLLSSLERLYSEYGIYIIFLGGIVESLFLLNIYAPGSFVILLGAVLAASGVVSLPLVIIAGTAGLVLGYSVDYLIGAKGWHEIIKDFKIYTYIEKSQKKLKEGNLVVFLSAVHPNPASFVAIAAGTAEYGYKKYIRAILIAQLLWSSFWGVLFYSFGVALLENMFYAAAGAVALILCGWWIFKKTSIQKYVGLGK